METLRAFILATFYYVFFTPMALMIRVFRRQAQLDGTQFLKLDHEFAARDFEEIF